MVDGIELGEFNLDGFMTGIADSEITDALASETTQLQIIFAIDASNSMQGHKIGAVNDAVNNVISKLKSFDRRQGNSIDISVIGYSTKLFRWTNGFVPVSDFKYSYIEMVDGLSDIGALYRELKVLSNEYMCAASKKYVVLFSDGLPTTEYSAIQNEWRNTAHYAEIVKIAISFDDDISDPQSAAFLNEFVDGGDVLSVKNQEQLLAKIMN